MGEGGKERGVANADSPQPHYGTFQGVSNYPPPPPHPQPAIGFPQPVPPPSASEPYANAYQAFPEDSMVKLDRICREANVMLVFAHSYGLTGFVRISVKETLYRIPFGFKVCGIWTYIFYYEGNVFPVRQAEKFRKGACEKLFQRGYKRANFSLFLEDCYYYTLQADDAPKPKELVSHSGQSVTLVGSRLIMFGGEDLHRQLMNDVHVLDLETMTWDILETTGSLYRLIHRADAGEVLDQRRRLRMALDVAKGINYLHCLSPPVVHWDLKSVGR